MPSCVSHFFEKADKKKKIPATSLAHSDSAVSFELRKGIQGNPRESKGIQGEPLEVFDHYTYELVVLFTDCRLTPAGDSLLCVYLLNTVSTV
jgi:hypothetical protein